MSAPQIKIAATYIRGGKLVYNSKQLLQLTVIAAKKCDFFLLAGIAMPSGSSLCHRGSAFLLREG
ncbi:hypothetical protein QE250_07850 [Chromatiaceae bacterium AAb-1]|nr:hypothetical protein [Chromatiaceae bacterium AAb-1]